MGTCSRAFTESKRTYSGSGGVVVFCGCGNKVWPEALFSQVGEYPNLKAREVNQIKVELALNSMKVGKGQVEFNSKRGTTWRTLYPGVNPSPKSPLCCVGASSPPGSPWGRTHATCVTRCCQTTHNIREASAVGVALENDRCCEGRSCRSLVPAVFYLKTKFSFHRRWTQWPM